MRRLSSNNVIDLTSIDDRERVEPNSSTQHIPGLGYAGSSPLRSEIAAPRYRQLSGHQSQSPGFSQFTHTSISARIPHAHAHSHPYPHHVVDLTIDPPQSHTQSTLATSSQLSGTSPSARFFPSRDLSSNVFEEMTGGALGLPTPSTFPGDNRSQRATGNFHRRIVKSYSSRSTSNPFPSRPLADSPTGGGIPMPAYTSRSVSGSPKDTASRANAPNESPRRIGSLKSLLNPIQRPSGIESKPTAPATTSPKSNGVSRSDSKTRRTPPRKPPAGNGVAPLSSPKAKQPERKTPQRSWHQTVLRSPIETKIEKSPTAEPVVSRPLKPEVTNTAFQKVLDEFIKDVRAEHDRMVRLRLHRARKMHEHKSTTPVNPNDHQSIPNRARQAKRHCGSPFADILAIDHGPRLAAPTECAINLGHFSNKQGKNSEFVGSYSINGYQDPSLAVPPYTTYISTKHNILVEDDKHRTAIPYLGEDTALDPDYRDMELKICSNADKFALLKAMDERANQYIPYMEEILERLGTDVDSVLDYLLNGREPSRIDAAIRSLRHTREDHLREGYYSESDDSDTMKSKRAMKKKRAKKQYRRARTALGKSVDQDKIDRAALACSVFAERAGFSFWHVVKHAADALANRQSPTRTNSTPNGKTPTTADPYSLSTYVDLGCLICKGHECPGHGEYEDEKDEKNLRIRVNHREYAREPRKSGDNERFLHAPYRELAGNIHEAFGMDGDSELSGKPWGKVLVDNTDDDVFPEREPCSEFCFWDKTIRSELYDVNRPPWAVEDTKALETLRPAYDDSRRAPCLIKHGGMIDKTCFEIFCEMFDAAPKEVKVSYKLQNKNASAHTKPLARRSLDYWLEFEETYLHHKREPFIPCNHRGPCDERSGCDCFRLSITCEKTCACSDNCKRKFKGCQCAARNKACFNSDNCECARLNRECDPDLCRSCGAHEVLDPVNRPDQGILHNRCSNASIQRGVPKRTLLGHSKMMADGGRSGWGLYVGEPCKKGDYVGEYVGEVVSSNEADQRGIIYDKRNLSYLFDVNRFQTLDSTLVGNKLRFINHQPKGHANVEPHTTFCNTVQRMGMFACKDIAIGEELFFDYGENFASKFNLIKLNHNAAPTIEKGKKDLPIKYTKHPPKVTLSKNGHRIGRPPKYEYLPKSHSASASKSRKRRFSALDGAAEISDSQDSTSASASNSNSASASHPRASNLDDTDASAADNAEGEGEGLLASTPDPDSDEDESEFNSDDALPRRRRKKRLRKRRSDYGVKKGPRKPAVEKGTGRRKGAGRGEVQVKKEDLGAVAKPRFARKSGTH